MTERKTAVSQSEMDRPQLQIEVMRLVDSGDLPAAFSFLEVDKDAVKVSASYIRLVHWLYNESKDVSRMLVAARRGIGYSLEAAGRETAAATAATLKENAKIIAFNAAANCWPGWGDEGATIEPAHLVEAVNLASQSLRLVEELELGHKRLGPAHWLIGALELARGNAAAADGEFERAQAAFHAEGAEASELMVQGYRALLRMRQPPSQDLGAAQFNDVLQRLKQDGSKQAHFYLQQLITADRLL